MSLLTEREWRTSYRHEDGDLIELFYNPALTCAVQYDRMTGYFSADALALAARGIAALITNDGRMRLIVGCTLQQPEQDAIGEGYDWRARLEAHLLAADLTPPDEEAGRGLEMLAWMVAQGHLDVKVAVPVDPDGRPAHAPGLYHEKVGILTDSEGNRLSFSGSINETAGGWVNNRESFHVHCGWFGLPQRWYELTERTPRPRFDFAYTAPISERPTSRSLSVNATALLRKYPFRSSGNDKPLAFSCKLLRKRRSRKKKVEQR